MVAFPLVCLHQNVLLLLSAYIRMVAFNLVRLYFHVCLFSCVPGISKGLLFLSCVPTSKCFPIFLCFYSLHLHQNVCQFSFASKSKCFLLLVCAYIKMFANSSLHLNQKCLLLLVCDCIKMVANSRLHVNPNVCFYSCAPTSKWLPILVYI